MDEDTRSLECRKCGCVVDPFDYIYRWAIEEWRISRDIKYLEKKQSQLYDEIERLKKEERNVKNRLKRAQKKLFEEKN